MMCTCFKIIIVGIAWAGMGALSGIYIPGPLAIVLPLIVVFGGVGWIMP